MKTNVPQTDYAAPTNGFQLFTLPECEVNIEKNAPVTDKDGLQQPVKRHRKKTLSLAAGFSHFETASLHSGLVIEIDLLPNKRSL